MSDLACMYQCGRELPEPDSPDAAGWWVNERVYGVYACPDCVERDLGTLRPDAWRMIGSLTADELRDRSQRARALAEVEADRLRAAADWYDERADEVD